MLYEIRPLALLAIRYPVDPFVSVQVSHIVIEHLRLCVGDRISSALFWSVNAID